MGLGKLPDTDIEGGEEAIFAEINITPLTDIFLVLLIIFMVGSTIAVEKMKEAVEDEKSSGLKVDLPSGQAKQIDPGQKSVVIGIEKGGQVVVDGNPITDQQLMTLLQNAFIRDKETRIVLRADKGVPHGRVVGVMDRANQVGLTKIAIATKGGG